MTALEMRIERLSLADPPERLSKAEEDALYTVLDWATEAWDTYEQSGGVNADYESVAVAERKSREMARAFALLHQRYLAETRAPRGS